ncbi:MAG: molybdopterin molybdotransferase MoeA, partial [Pseudomonadota bacterium]
MTDTPPDCFSPPKPLMTEADALTALKSNLRPVEEHETRPLHEAAGLYLSQPIRAPRAVPAHDNAAVDGYAVHSSIFNKPPPYRLPVVGTAWAGKPLETSVGPAEAARIFTGAVMPSGTDCVLMQEHVSAQNNLIEFSVNGREGLNRRLAGEDTGLDETVLERGDRLGAAALATVASLGIGEVSVYRPLRVAVLSTGDELAEPGMAYRPGTVYDSNRPLLRALLSTYPVALTDLGSAADTRSEVESLLKTAARAHDLLITSGGASTGEGDHVTSAVQSAGELHLWRLAIKPGKPIGFGQIGACTVVCLPGNPVAAFTGFVLFIRPMLSRLG